MYLYRESCIMYMYDVENLYKELYINKNKLKMNQEIFKNKYHRHIKSVKFGGKYMWIVCIKYQRHIKQYVW